MPRYSAKLVSIKARNTVVISRDVDGTGAGAFYPKSVSEPPKHLLGAEAGNACCQIKQTVAAPEEVTMI